MAWERTWAEIASSVVQKPSRRLQKSQTHSPLRAAYVAGEQRLRFGGDTKPLVMEKDLQEPKSNRQADGKVRDSKSPL